MRSRRGVLAAGMIVLSMTATASAQSGSKGDAEKAVQAYLSMWSGPFDATAVDRFYAPLVIYYGKPFSRAQVFRDKETYVRRWPVRRYLEVPGTMVAHCDAGQTVCRVDVDMTWRRVSRSHVVSVGRARLSFDFVPVEGARKIARESARIL